MIHNLKIKKKYADRILTGEKTFEVRLNDRDYQKGDIIKFRVIDKKMPKQGEPYHEIEDMEFLISYIHTGYGMSNEFSRAEKNIYDYVILGIIPLHIANKHVDEGSKDGQGTTNED